jgi:hypothetical protein
MSWKSVLAGDPTGEPPIAVMEPTDRRLDAVWETKANRPTKVLHLSEGVVSVSCSERRKEIKRRRHRRKKIELFKKRLNNATVSEKQHIAGKLRELTPGAEAVVQHWALEER